MAEKLALQGGSPVRAAPFPEWPVHGTEEREGLLEVLDSGQWSGGGPKEQRFSREFAGFCASRHALCVSNGSVALELALKALEIGPGDEVIVPALTWPATAWAALQVRATPVFADVRRDSWCLDPDDVARKLTSKTRAIIPVHLYDQIAPMDALLAIAVQRKLKVIEDCAHAHGSVWGGRPVGSLGDIGCFSFQLSKAMTSGEGGAVVTQRDALADRLHGLANCGRRRTEDAPFGFGGNQRITEFQAAILSAQLRRLPEQLETRARNIAQLRRLLEDLDGTELLERDARVTRRGLYGVAIRHDASAFAGTPRDVLVAALNAEGIPATPPYEVVYQSVLWRPAERLWRFEASRDPRRELGLAADCPVAEEISRDTGIVLPHNLFLGTPEDVEDIARTFRKIQTHADQLAWRSRGQQLRRAARRVLRSD